MPIKALISLMLLLLPNFFLCQNLRDSGKVDKIDPVGLTVQAYNKITGVKNKIILVYFKADWCSVCKKQRSILDEVIKEHKLQLLVIDMEDNPLIAEYFEVDGLPILILYKDGNLVWDRMGFKQKNELLAVLKLFE